MTKKESNRKRIECRDAYLQGTQEIKSLATMFAVSEKTIRKWIKNGKWDEHFEQITTLGFEIQVKVKKALVTALNNFAHRSESTALQSLVNLLKNYLNMLEPSREFVEYMKRFFLWQIDFLEKQGEFITAELIRQNMLGPDGMVEYFRKKAMNG